MISRKKKEDQIPLLDEDEENEVSSVRQRRTANYQIPHRSADLHATFKITAVFVVVFDIKKGNMIEWINSKDALETRGLEFKALPSGAHKVDTDFVIFKYAHFFGAACYQTVKNDTSQRGAIIKSVGILTGSHEQLFRYRNFLEEQVRFTHTSPGDYSPLLNFFDGTCQDFGDSVIRPAFLGKDVSSKITALDLLESLKGTLFKLWKLVVLRKRILFVTNPPVENICRAGSTEKVFEMKPDLYDCLVMDGKIIIHDPVLAKACDISASDEAKESEILHALKIGTGDLGAFNQEEFLLDYFSTLSNRILTGFQEAQDGKLTTEDIVDMSLDPVQDLDFLQEFASVYDFQVELPGTSWCPRCRCC